MAFGVNINEIQIKKIAKHTNRGHKELKVNQDQLRVVVDPMLLFGLDYPDRFRLP